MKHKHRYRKLPEKEYGKDVYECKECGWIRGQEKLKNENK